MGIEGGCFQRGEVEKGAVKDVESEALGKAGQEWEVKEEVGKRMRKELRKGMVKQVAKEMGKEVGQRCGRMSQSGRCEVGQGGEATDFFIDFHRCS